jgi:4-hydroxybenzoate polyprenyltransferase
MPITPDLRQNIFYTVYFSITHNFPALFYALGIVAAVALSIIKPSRKSVFLLLGFILLLLGFEYEKHIVEGLREQTINSLITIQEHNKVRRVINVLTLKALPLGLPLLGWVFVLSSLFLYIKPHVSKKRG